MADSLRWGIVGTGRMARAFAADLALLPDARVTAVASRTPDKARAFGAEFGAAHHFDSAAALAASGTADIAYIATPHALHCADTLACIEAGMPVLCEKPFALSAAQAGRMVDAARRRGVFLMEALWTRFVPAVVHLRERLAADAIGPVQLLLAGGAFIPEPDPDFYLFRRDLGGGVLLDAGVYLLNMASMILGAPASVQAAGNVTNTGIDDHDGILLGHAGGGLALLHVSLRARAAPDMTLLGTRGRIHVAAPIFCPRRLTFALAGAPEDVREFPFDGSGYRFQAAEAARCMRAGLVESPVMTHAETLQIMATLDAVRGQLGVTYPGE